MQERLKVLIDIEGMGELKRLIEREAEIVRELRKNTDAINAIRMEINIAMEKVTS